MKIKYVLILVVLAFLGGIFLPTQCGDSNIAYWKGRSEKALEDLQQAEEKFEEAMKQDEALQEEKDKHIARLEEEIAEEEQVIIVKEKAIVVTRDMLIASGLYKGLVKELDEKWASKYASLESVLEDERQKNREWIEKFDSKVNIAIQAYIDNDVKQRAALEEFQKRCSSYERQIKRLKLKGEIWKWAAIGGGGYIGYKAIKGIL